jgi:hypothetical protein
MDFFNKIEQGFTETIIKPSETFFNKTRSTRKKKITTSVAKRFERTDLYVLKSKEKHSS